MGSLTVTAKGQVTLKREVLQHMDIQPGDKIEYETLPGGEIRLRAHQTQGSIDDFLHALDGRVKLDKPLSIDDMNTIIEQGWAGTLKDQS